MGSPSYAQVKLAWVLGGNIMMGMQPNMHHYHWLKRRGITDPIIEQFGLRVGDHGSMKGAIVIPIHDEKGTFLYNKYRRDPLDDRKPKYIYDKGGSLALYGAGFAVATNTVLVTEGEMDALVAWSAHIPAVSSTGGAMSFKSDWGEFFANKETYLCFDNDEPGGAGMVKAKKIIPHAKIVFLPDAANIKDISDYVTHGGDLHALLATARVFTSDADIIEDRAARVALFKSTHFHDAWLAERDLEREWENRPKVDRKSDDEVDRARGYPIPKLLAITADGKAKCLWHNERTPSMHYYPETNHVYCFGCGKHGDAIDVYRALNGGTFRNALKALA